MALAQLSQIDRLRRRIRRWKIYPDFGYSLTGKTAQPQNGQDEFRLHFD